MKQIGIYAKKMGLKPSFCCYKRWGVKKKHGHKPVIPLRFSKSGNTEIEKAYATHYVDSGRTEQLKKKNGNKPYLLVKRKYLTKQGIKLGGRCF